ncbi:MAG TPA: hypothetical protein PLC99_24405 [Verrucomicrobiota bacterium]|nr:hypothetical protein [Verrucomicrobiota bacterium]
MGAPNSTEEKSRMAAEALDQAAALLDESGSVIYDLHNPHMPHNLVGYLMITAAIIYNGDCASRAAETIARAILQTGKAKDNG